MTMKSNKNNEYKSKVYTDRPPYADFEAPAKFEAIKSIIAKRLIEHPNAICSYSGGSDSDIMLHLIETVRQTFNLPPISAKAVEDLEKIRPYEPNLVKAAWNVFGDSYRYRQQYNEYKKKRTTEERTKEHEMKYGEQMEMI